MILKVLCSSFLLVVEIVVIDVIVDDYELIIYFRERDFMQFTLNANKEEFSQFYEDQILNLKIVDRCVRDYNFK